MKRIFQRILRNTVELLYMGLLYVGHSYIWDSLTWNGETCCVLCVRHLLYVGHSFKWDTPLYGTVSVVPGRFTELLYMGREATKAFLQSNESAPVVRHLDKWDRRL